MPDSLFFDLDGTLTNLRDGIIRCIRYALDGVQVAAPSDDELTQWIGPPMFDSFRDFFGHARHHLVTRAVSLYRKRYGTDGMLENLLYPGVSEGLRLSGSIGSAKFCVSSGALDTAFARLHRQRASET